MSEFLTNAENFQDCPLLEQNFKYMPDCTFPCPVCKRHGKWNLTVDAYGKGKHFQAHCTQCNGWGWVNKADFDCAPHDFEELPSGKMCWHNYKCKKCGQERGVDSSD